MIRCFIAWLLGIFWRPDEALSDASARLIATVEELQAELARSRE